MATKKRVKKKLQKMAVKGSGRGPSNKSKKSKVKKIISALKNRRRKKRR